MSEQLLCPLAEKVVKKLFTVFFAICNGFEKQYADKNRLKLQQVQWIIAFMEEGITEWRQIESAVSHCRRLPGLVYTPQLGDFLSYINKNKQESITSFEIAYMECCEKSHPSADKETWSHPVVFHSWSEMKSFNFINKPEKESKRMYEAFYNQAKNQFLDGKPLKQIQKAIQGAIKEDKWKTMKAYGSLPEYAHINTHEKCLKALKEINPEYAKIFERNYKHANQ